MGTPRAAVPSLERLVADGNDIVGVYTQPDRPAGRGRQIVSSPVKQFAIEHDLPVYQPAKIKTPDAIEAFRGHDADIAVVIAYGRILPEQFLDAYPYGAVNVHFSLLPKYRGAAPVNWAIVKGDTETGVTTMRMDAGLDTGPVLLQEKVSIGVDETSVGLLDRLAALAPEVLSKTLAGLEMLRPQVQDDNEATFAPILKREDGEIDWNWTATEIANRVRGFQPFPTAFTFHNGKRITIWRALPQRHGAEMPGEILAVHDGELVVACGGDSALRIDELQAEGRQRLTAREFLNGGKLRAGDILGR